MRDLMDMKAPTGETPAADEAAKEAILAFETRKELIRLMTEKDAENDTTQKPRPEELASQPAAPHS